MELAYSKLQPIQRSAETRKLEVAQGTARAYRITSVYSAAQSRADGAVGVFRITSASNAGQCRNLKASQGAVKYIQNDN